MTMRSPDELPTSIDTGEEYDAAFVLLPFDLIKPLIRHGETQLTQ